MPRPISHKSVVKVLNTNGFSAVSQSGSHVKYRKNGDVVLTVIVRAGKKEIPYGTFRSIVNQSGISEEDFRK